LAQAPVARKLSNHFPSALFVEIPQSAQPAVEHRDHNVTVAPATERSTRAPQCSNHLPSLRLLACVRKENDDYLLQPSAPNPEIMNRIGIILAQNLGQQSQAFAQPGLEKLL
jgi:hypothetical protein